MISMLELVKVKKQIRLSTAAGSLDVLAQLKTKEVSMLLLIFFVSVTKMKRK